MCVCVCVCVFVCEGVCEGVRVCPCAGGRTFLVVNNSSLMKLAQMYEFIAEGPQEKKL